MPRYEVTVEAVFSAAHALRLPDGSLEPLHGHDWQVAVTVASDGLDAMDTVMDFHQLEASLQAVIGPWHNRCLNEVEPFGVELDGDLDLVVNPSAERVAERIGLAVAADLPEAVHLASVSVGEAPGCTARYRPASP